MNKNELKRTIFPKSQKIQGIKDTFRNLFLEKLNVKN